MADANVTFCKNSPDVEVGNFPVADLGSAEDVLIGASSVQTSGTSTHQVVRIHAEAAIRLAIGENPTAGNDDTAMAAGATEYFRCEVGDKVAIKQF